MPTPQQNRRARRASGPVAPDVIPAASTYQVDPSALTIGEIEDMADALDLEVKDLERVIKRNPISLSVFWTKWQQQERAGVPRNRRITMAEARNATPEQMVEIFTAAGMMPAEDADPNAESGSRAASMDT